MALGILRAQLTDNSRAICNKTPSTRTPVNVITSTHDTIHVHIRETIYKEYTSQVKHCTACPPLRRNGSKLRYKVCTPPDIGKGNNAAYSSTGSILQWRDLEQKGGWVWVFGKWRVPFNIH